MLRRWILSACCVLLLAQIGGVIAEGADGELLYPFLDCDVIFAEPCDSTCYLQSNLPLTLVNVSGGGSSGALEEVFVGNDSDFVVGSGIALGISDEFCAYRRRMEIEGNWQGLSNQSAIGAFGGTFPVRQNTWTAMANMWWDIPINEYLSVYAGGGLGVASTNVTVYTGFGPSSNSTTAFAYQLGTGITLPLCEDADLDIGYRFVDCGTNTVAVPGGAYIADTRIHQAMLSVRWYLY
ncbi:MAG: porin family protein [Planctomycetaceae bacterium]|nr:porin family protein [Planctomycetaceae bacterium]